MRHLFFVSLLLIAGQATADVYPLPPAGESLIGEVQYVTTRYEDTLLDLGRRYGIGYEEMLAANPGVDPWVPGADRKITLPTRFILPDAPRQGVVVNVAEHRLYYFPLTKPGQPAVVKTFPISLGKENWSTPLGRTTITAKVKNPTWYPPASVRKEHADRGEYLPAAVRPGKDNPLGEFAMRLGFPGGTFLIHGTNKPTGIGMAVTHGCIRMFPEDIEAFFKEVPVGTSVLIIDQPFKMGWSQGRMYLEVHKPAEVESAQWGEGLTNVTRAFVAATKDRPAQLQWSAAERIYLRASGLPTPVEAAVSN